MIGPREVPRLWSRHILNCAVVGDLIPRGARVVDVGSGAGLPGIALAIARPDLSVVLVDSLQRRVSWLVDAVEELELGNAVEVRRGRAEEMAGDDFDVATARAVAGLSTLIGWCVPLVRPGGVVLAIKGRTAEEELIGVEGQLTGLGVEDYSVQECGSGVLEEPTTVVSLVVADRTATSPTTTHGRAGGPTRSSRAVPGDGGRRTRARRRRGRSSS